MEFKTDALLLRSVDYRDNDKMVTLLTADRGKIGAAMKGVKKAGAKLRFAAQPFCFAEYVLTQKGEHCTVISASLYDSFFSLSEDVFCFYAASAVLEICDKLSYEELDSRALLVAAVGALNELRDGKGASSLIRFLLQALSFAGYPVRAEKCPFCGKELFGRLRFDMDSGSFACNDCEKGAPASEITYKTVRAALHGESLGEKDGQVRALRLLSAYFCHHTESELRALPEALGVLETDFH